MSRKSETAAARQVARSRAPTIDQARAALAGRLRKRRSELEQVALTRIQAIDSNVSDPIYLEGQRAALSAAVDYGIEVVETGEAHAPPPPPLLLIQARVAARNGVSLDVVLRRYLAGYTLLGDLMVGEAEESGLLETSALRHVLRAEGVQFNALLAAISAEYTRETRSQNDTQQKRRARRVQRILEGEQLDISDLGYRFEACHTGAIVVGPGASEAARGLTESLDCLALVVARDRLTVWLWLASRSGLDPAELGSIASQWPAELCLAAGEPAEGLAGWRLTHQQAKAALPITMRTNERFVRYADVALLASAVQDELLTTSLPKLFLAPLEAERDRGKTAKCTLRAYFASGRNVSSAAAALGVNRHTVTSRLRTIEDKLGHSLLTHAVPIEIALHLETLGFSTPSR